MMDVAERRIILTYAPTRPAGDALAALLTLDDRLGETLRTTREPMLGQIRLQWWHDSLCRLDIAPPPAEPVLEGIAGHLIPAGITGSMVAEIVDGWQVLLEEQLNEAALRRFAGRGRRLFELAARLADAAPADPVALAGEGWALADVALRLSDPEEAAVARQIAEDMLKQAAAVRWSRNGRALGAMAHLARLDLAGVPVGAPKRTGRALWHRMTGR